MKADPRGVVFALRRAVKEGNHELADYLGGEISAWIERTDALEAEVENLRGMLGYCVTDWRDGCAIDHFDFQDEMVKRGLLVEVPADEAFRDEWDVETMFVLAWTKDADATPTTANQTNTEAPE